MNTHQLHKILSKQFRHAFAQHPGDVDNLIGVAALMSKAILKSLNVRFKVFLAEFFHAQARDLFDPNAQLMLVITQNFNGLYFHDIPKVKNKSKIF